MAHPDRRVIIVHGTVCLDRVLQVPRLPLPGGYVEVLREIWVLGGEAANTAMSLKRWNAPFRLLANPVGMDADGKRLISLIKEAEFDVPQVEGARTPICEIYVTPDGERTMYGLGFSDLEQHPFQPFDCADTGWFTTDSNLGRAAIAGLEFAHAGGLFTVAMDFAHRPDPIPHADLHLTSTDWLKEPPNDWTAKTGQSLLLTSGATGATLCQPGSAPVRLPPYPAGEVVDTTGAGDCFRAGLLYGLQEGLGVRQAARYGAAAAALKVGSLGATSGIPSLADVIALIAKNPEVTAAYE